MNEPFDFDAHRQRAMAEYAKIRPLYETLSSTIKEILKHALADAKVHSIEARAKTVTSFGDKAATPQEESSDEPKYPEPISQIADKSGIRVIVFFPRTLAEVESVVRHEFNVLEKVDHTAVAVAEQRLGYLSVHFIVELREERLNLPEYRKLRAHRAEIQVRTVMQHAWAEIEHDIQYKSTYAVPVEVRRRFITLAGLLEVADREFQAIQDRDSELRNTAIRQLNAGETEQVAITASSLKAYLDRRFGSDARHTSFSYEWMTKVLLELGFTTFGQIDKSIENLDSESISYKVFGNRQSQITRFDLTLLAAMKDEYIKRHPWRDHEWFVHRSQEHLREMIPESASRVTAST